MKEKTNNTKQTNKQTKTAKRLQKPQPSVKKKL